MDRGVESRIGILGGTFNPVHLGHLILAQSAFESCDLTKVLFIPCARPPTKPTRRCRRRAAPGHGGCGDPQGMPLEASDLELRRGGTPTRLTRCPNWRPASAAPLFFLIGDDTLPELHLWREIYALLPLCRSDVPPRAGGGPAARGDLHLDPPWPERLLADYQDGPRIEISFVGYPRAWRRA